MDDLKIPENKKEIISGSEEKENYIYNQYYQGLITEEEKISKVIEIWNETTSRVQKEMGEQMDKNSSSFLMMTSGARGKIGQFSQMAGMKGLVVNAVGRIIELPIKSNYKEGLSSLEYFESTHGARKGLSDTALKTSDSGYLTRRLVDVSQDVIVTIPDCGTKDTSLISRTESKAIGEDFAARIKGRVLGANVVDAKTGVIIAKKSSLIDDDIFETIDKSGVEEVYIRSISNCKAEWGVCQKCYGSDLAKGGLIALGEAVGIIAAQSIGEPGTQLTMRTFHAGGVAGADITQGLPRVEELFEARQPKGQAILAEISGKVHIETNNGKNKIEIVSQVLNEDTYDAIGYEIEVKNNQFVELRDILATKDGKKPIKAKNPGTIKIKDHEIHIIKEANVKTYETSSQVGSLIQDGATVEVGEAITEGSWNLQEALKLLGEKAVQRYIVKEVQQTYASEGQTINDKHIEIIIRQMFSRCRIEEANETPFVVGEIVSRTALNKANREAGERGGKAADYNNLLLSISKVALTTDSFLSAASFQETSKVLIGAAVAGKVDELKGLKENVIIGKLIPAGTGFNESLTKGK
jgi:DNA-directed RNA polymerase subunit beta'